MPGGERRGLRGYAGRGEEGGREGGREGGKEGRREGGKEGRETNRERKTARKGGRKGRRRGGGGRAANADDQHPGHTMAYTHIHTHGLPSCRCGVSGECLFRSKAAFVGPK